MKEVHSAPSSCDARPGAGRPKADCPARRLRCQGEEYLSDAELLGVVIGAVPKGYSSVGIARVLLAQCGSLRRIGRLSSHELSSLPGIGEATAARILAAFALSRRFASEVLEPGAPFRSRNDLFEYFNRKLRDRKREEFIAVLLDGKNRFLKEEKISLGSLTASIVHPREVFLPAIRESAGGVILVHNHPSGDPSPSREDLEVTDRLVRAGEILGIRVLDHIIIGESSFTSLVYSES